MKKCRRQENRPDLSDQENFVLLFVRSGQFFMFWSLAFAFWEIPKTAAESFLFSQKTVFCLFHPKILAEGTNYGMHAFGMLCETIEFYRKTKQIRLIFTSTKQGRYPPNEAEKKQML